MSRKKRIDDNLTKEEIEFCYNVAYGMSYFKAAQAAGLNIGNNASKLVKRTEIKKLILEIQEKMKERYQTDLEEKIQMVWSRAVEDGSINHICRVLEMIQRSMGVMPHAQAKDLNVNINYVVPEKPEDE